jgi:hypothetical protein
MRSTTAFSGSGRLRRVAARLAVLLLPLPLLAVAPAPAHASATPWAFAEIATGQAAIAAGAIGSAVATCPDGYFPVGGGFSNYYDDYFERVSEYRENQTWKVTVHSKSGSTIWLQVSANCILVSNLNLTYVSDSFYRNATTGLGGGTVRCPTGWEAISGGMEWSATGVTRRVDLSSPTSDGGGWYAAGYSPDANTYLYVEAWCAPTADLGVSAPMVTARDTSINNYFELDQVCPAGTRQLSGGAFLSAANYDFPNPAQYRGFTYYSLPIKPDTWRSTTNVNVSGNGATRVTNVVWCVPASITQYSFAQAPPARPAKSTSTTATFQLNATNPAGEPMTSTCQLDYQGTFQPCPLNSPFEYQNLYDGGHTLRMEVHSASGTVYPQYQWDVDTTAPQAYKPPAEHPIVGPITVTFTEPVVGVTTSTMRVRATGTTALLPGSITLSSNVYHQTVAAWTPSAPFVPGETYEVLLGSGITDVSGNALVPTTLSSRTALVVQNTSPALRSLWDRDTTTAANGGGFIVANQPGSLATWLFNATAGQTAVLHGTRLATGGYAEVWLDGVKKATITNYASVTTWKVKLYTSPALTAGKHSLEVRVLGTKPTASKGTYVALDDLTVGTTVLQETSSVQRFRRAASSSASEGSYDGVTYATSGDTGGGPSWFLTFKGTGVRLYVTKSSGFGSSRVYIDGVLKATVSLNTSSTTAYKQQVYAITGLSNARHSVRFIPVGTASGTYSYVNVDYLTVVAPALA